MKDLTLLSVNWNQQPCIELLLKSFAKHHYEGEPINLILVDNNSQDDSREWMTENGIPFVALEDNIGHENAINHVYPNINQRNVLLCDSDIEFHDNIYDYVYYLRGRCVALGEFVVNYFEQTRLKDRISPWFTLFDIQTIKANGINLYRDPECKDWTYDVGSWFFEQMAQKDLQSHYIHRLPGNQDNDLVSMKYERFWHWGKVSWDVHGQHGDRITEVISRRKAIKERLELYKYVDLKGKFVSPL
jgi:glycosyltransferase involved in cell wall biosynthesis